MNSNFGQQKLWEGVSFKWSSFGKERHLCRVVRYRKCLWFSPSSTDIFCSEKIRSTWEHYTYYPNYYGGLWSKSFSEHVLSDWQKHLRGILFLASMNVVLEYVATSKVLPYETSNSLALPLARAFMDNLSLVSPSIGTSFKVNKSRSVVISKGKVEQATPFSLVKMGLNKQFHLSSRNPLNFWEEQLTDFWTTKGTVTTLKRNS